jgi:hypothetical protein
VAAEPTTYREVLEHAVSQIEERIYFSNDPPPRWIMGLAVSFARALERNSGRRLG